MSKKICNICKTTVDTSKEHIKISQYNKEGRLDNVSYYHIICFRDKITNRLRTRSLQEGARKLQEGCANMLNKVQERIG